MVAPARPGGPNVVAGVTGILLTQRAMTSPEPPDAFLDFWECAYQAADD
jgi:hypothetical protein